MTVPNICVARQVGGSFSPLVPRDNRCLSEAKDLGGFFRSSRYLKRARYATKNLGSASLFSCQKD